MSRGGCSRPESSRNPSCRFLEDRQLGFLLDSGREYPLRDMSSSETGNCYGGIDVWWRGYELRYQTLQHSPNDDVFWFGGMERSALV
eukprot:gene18365-biopygen637